jgi:hypothetical protein
MCPGCLRSMWRAWWRGLEGVMMGGGSISSRSCSNTRSTPPRPCSSASRTAAWRKRSAIRLRLADAAFLYQPKEFRKACKAVREWATFFADKAMRYKEEQGEDAAAEKYPFIIDLWREMGNVGLVRDQLLHVLVAGRDSTASLLCWTLYVPRHLYSPYMLIHCQFPPRPQPRRPIAPPSRHHRHPHQHPHYPRTRPLPPFPTLLLQRKYIHSTHSHTITH